ncbi:MAG: carbohydrate-binding protein [Clostridia bacterium]|nr:carbohydrate-binding protein [Clostridia bacterium]
MKLTVKDREGTILAQAEHAEEARLCVEHVWDEGDEVEVSAPPMSHIWLGTDASVPEGEVFCPDGHLVWRVPAGEHRRAYAPGAFTAERNILSARLMSKAEIMSVRDIARNPLDLRGDTAFYPHCTANVETRGESVFAARNVIDGFRYNTSHGKWPYESWGIGAREDAWCRLDFGRPVIAERMALTLRADFPHDAYWVSGHVVDSDGNDTIFELKKTGERQWIELGGREVRWLRLERMIKSDDPSAFPSLRAWEVLGRDL